MERITPENIISLKDNEIFVFGSNIQGNHAGGAAWYARERFGAIMGKGNGLQGFSYAIPTMFDTTNKIRPYVDEFIAFAKEHPRLTFLVTKIGCGIAGWEVSEIATMFRDAVSIKNIWMPEEFWEILKGE